MSPTGAPEGKIQVTWQKTFREENVVPRGSGHDALALSAFMLSALPNPVAQKEMVKEMWDSGADTIVCHCLHLVFVKSTLIYTPGFDRP